jgi:hypothetical protein
VAATKRELYLLPAYPAVALLYGVWFGRLCRADAGEPDGGAPRARPVRIYTLVLAAVFLLLGVASLIGFVILPRIAAGADLNEQEQMVAAAVRMPFAAMGIVMLAGAAWMGLSWRSGRIWRHLTGIAGSHVLLYAVILGVVMPAWNPVKTYEPQSRWISEQIGDATHFAMVDPWGIPRRGGFAYYTGTMVDLLDDADDVRQFFERYPGSVVLIRDEVADRVFAGDEAAWQQRILREIRVGSHVYIAIGPPR